MTRKDYVLIARTIKGLGPINAYAIAMRFAETLERENPRFDAGRFLAACMPAPEGVAL